MTGYAQGADGFKAKLEQMKIANLPDEEKERLRKHFAKWNVNGTLPMDCTCPDCPPATRLHELDARSKKDEPSSGLTGKIYAHWKSFLNLPPIDFDGYHKITLHSSHHELDPPS